MTDYRELRDKLRAGGTSAPQSGVGGLIMWSLAFMCTVPFAFYGISLLLAPRIEPLKPSAEIPTFSGTRIDGSKIYVPPPPTATAAQGAAIRVNPADVAGKGANEVGKMADEVCFKRAHALHPHWSKSPRLTTKFLDEFHLDEMNHFNALMQCLITEAPTRYCSSSQRRMIVGEIDHYFRAIGYMNRDLEQLKRLAPNFELTFNDKPLPTAEPDPPVIMAIEMRLRDGYLTLADRDRINASAPPDIRTRLARIEPRKSPCPEQPWWAFWR